MVVIRVINGKMKVFLLAIFCLFSISAHAVIQAIGNVQNTQVFESHVVFTLENNVIARIDLLDPYIARVRINPNSQLSTIESPAVFPTDLLPPQNTIHDTPDYTWLITDQMMLAVGKSPFRVFALHSDGNLMTADLEPAVLWDDETDMIATRKYMPDSEHILGLGMRGGPIERKNRMIVMRNTDYSAFGEFTDPLYQSYPFYYGVQGGKAYGVFQDNPAQAFFDMGVSEPNVLFMGAVKGELNYYLLAGPQSYQVANAYSRLTGFNQLPPKWSLGYHHSRYGWQSEAEITAVADQLRVQDFPTDALWFDIDYMDNFQAFTWHPVNFPQPQQMHQNLMTQGFHSVYINEPCIHEDDQLWPVFDQGDHFVKNQLGESHLNSIWFGNVSWIDYSKTDTRNWYKEQLKTFLDSGINGLWNDLNEPANNFMPDAVFDFDGQPRSEMEGRNLYALLVNKVAYEAQIELRPNTRPWNFSRSGYSGIQRYAHTWGGDANTSFDSLRVNIQMSVNMGLSGQNQFGHDIGGFLGTPSAELFIRWMEFSLFTPLFRNHSANITAPREPWVFGEPYTSLIRGLIKWRYRFLPYTYSLFDAAHHTGRPVLTPTFFYSEGDEQTFQRDMEYLFGPNLLVAPVYEEGAVERSLYLPAGNYWVNMMSNEVFLGGQIVIVPTPLGMPVIFSRVGGIYPLAYAGRYVDDPLNSTDMEIVVYPHGSSRFVLYEDDGRSFNYQNGDFLRTEILSVNDGINQSITIRRLEGQYLPLQRTWLTKVHFIAAKPQNVNLNGIALVEVADLNSVDQGWKYDAAGKFVQFKMADDANVLLVDMIL